MKKNVFLDNTPVYNSHFHKKMNKRQLQDMILNISESLALGFRLKEMYLNFNKTAKENDCVAWLDSIIVAFNESGIPEYNEFISLLINWKTEILNSFKRPFDDRKLSNALCENINGQIRSYLTISNGVSNFFRFRKRCILALKPHVFYSINNNLKTDKRDSKPRGNYKFK